MLSIRNIYFIVLVFFVNSEFSYSQNSDDIYPKKELLNICIPHLTHASNVTNESGFSIAYSYPGFFSYLGQISFYYKTKDHNSFFVSFGEVYLMTGVTKSLYYFNDNNSRFFLNINVGLISENEFLGSLGFSYLVNLTSNNRFEIITDIFFNHGYDTDIISDKDYSQGILLFFNYSNSISKNIIINLGLGISLIRYRYVYTPNSGVISGGKIYKYEYVCKETEQYYLNTGLGLNPSWDYQVIFPFGITVSYKF